MTETTQQTKPKKESTGKKDALVIILLAFVAFGAGFVIVHYTLPEQASLNVVSADNSNSESVQPESDPNSNIDPQDNSNIDDTTEEIKDQGNALPVVPPGKTPEGIKVEGTPHYLKCSTGDNNTKGDDCDRLETLEKRINTRLYVIDKCKNSIEPDAIGILSLGVNMDFDNNEIKFWSGPSSTLDSSSKIGKCVRRELKGLPVHDINHKFSVYRIFYTIEFYDVKKYQQQLAKKRKRGRLVEIIKDHVNVRMAPVDGDSMGRISSDSKVTLIGKNSTKEWCNVITPKDNEGWMICSALKL